MFFPFIRHVVCSAIPIISGWPHTYLLPEEVYMSKALPVLTNSPAVICLVEMLFVCLLLFPRLGLCSTVRIQEEQWPASFTYKYSTITSAFASKAIDTAAPGPIATHTFTVGKVSMQASVSTVILMLPVVWGSIF